MTLKRKIISGFKWSLSTQAIKQCLQFVISVLLARFLHPKDFGLISMVLVFTSFASLLGDSGFEAAIVQKKQINEEHLSSVYLLNISIGLFLSTLFLFLSPLVSYFYEQPILKNITMLISVTFFLRAFCIVPTAILKRAMDFKKLAMVEIISISASGILTISLSLLNFGVWSLVIQQIVLYTTAIIVLHIIIDWRPKLAFSKKAIGELTRFSGNLLGFNLVNFFSRFSDNLLIGKFLNAESLGIYTRTYNIMLIPVIQISLTLGKVMFPSLSKYQDDPEQAKGLYLKVIRGIAFFTFPTMIGLLVIADSFVIVLIGQRWIDMIPVLRILCIVGLLQSVVSTTGWIYNSQGRTDLLLKWGICTTCIGIISFLIGIKFGSIIAVAYCYLTANICLLYHNIIIPGKLIGLNFREVVSAIKGPFFCGILMGIMLAFSGSYMVNCSHVLQLIINIVLGVIFYILLMAFFKVKAYSDIKALWGT